MLSTIAALRLLQLCLMTLQWVTPASEQPTSRSSRRHVSPGVQLSKSPWLAALLIQGC